MLAHPILTQSDFKLLRFCDRCGNKFIPLYGRYHNYCPTCNQAQGNIIDLTPSFTNVKKLVGGGFSKQIFKARRASSKFEKETLIKDIRNKIIKEFHRAGIFTYEELEIFFGIKTRRLHELSNMDHKDLLTKNCVVCGNVMEFGNNYYLYYHKRYCCPECKSKSRRKEFRHLKNKMIS